MDFMTEVGLAVPPMDSHESRRLFVDMGCVVCHAVNGIGGEIGPALDADQMPNPMNAFEFAARMWRGASSMVPMQEELFGEPVALAGQELADLVAFAHDETEQSELSIEQVPARFRALFE